MNIILLSPHYPPNQINYARAVKKYGDVALGIGDTPNISDELRNTLDEYVYVEDMTNYDHMLRTVGYLTSKYGKIDRIDSQNEFWLGIEARLREDFNIFGQKTAQTDVNRSKLGMKAAAKAAGIPVAEGTEVISLEQLRDFIHKVGLPVVVKPVIGVGATATYAIHHENEIEDYYNRIKDHKYICEKYIFGTIVTFDGFVDRHGNILFKTSHEYSEGVMESVNGSKSVSFYNVREIDPALETLGRKTIQAFKVRERFFHIEWFRTAPHEYCLLEINVRPPGFYIIDMMNYSADISLYETWAASFHDFCPFNDVSLKYSVGFAGRRKQDPFKHSVQDIVEKYKENIMIAEPVPGVFAEAMGDFFFIVRHPDTDQLKSILNYILEH